MSTICQIALSVKNLEATIDFYREIFGFEMAGETMMFRGSMAEKIQGLPGAASRCGWLITNQDFLQLELFEFERPTPKHHPADWQPSDIGYNGITIAVNQFDEIIRNLNQQNIPLLNGIHNINGSRRVCVFDPDQVLLEIQEDESIRHSPQLSGIIMSVPSLPLSRKIFGDALNFPEKQIPHTNTDKLWHKGKTQKNSCVYDLEWGELIISEYSEPQPKNRPINYQISDYGILNVAVGFREDTEFNQTLEKLKQYRAIPNYKTVNFGYGKAIYVTDPQGFSIELLLIRSWADGIVGFKKPSPTTQLVMGQIDRVIRYAKKFSSG